MGINKPFTIIILLAINVLLLALFVVPKYRELQELRAAAGQKYARFEAQSKRYQNMLDLIKSAESRPEALAKVEDALPEKPSFGSLVYFLGAKAQESGLALTSFSFSQTPSFSAQLGGGSSTDVKSLSFTFVVAGSYQGLKNFLAKLEKSARLLEVGTITFSSLSGQGQADSYNFQLTVRTHSL